MDRDERFEREVMLFGDDGVDSLGKCHVALFGVGGVGSYAAEALARCGVGKITLVDSDNVSVTNINRQLCALTSTVGRPKVSVTAERLRDINPKAEVFERKEFFLPENSDSFDFGEYDYVIDAIDTVAGKLEIARRCYLSGTPLISCMGTGNKLDPTALKVTDITKTSTCPLARVMRRELRRLGIPHLKVVYSEEAPIKSAPPSEGGKTVPASVAFVPSVAGLIAASEAVKHIVSLGIKDKEDSADG